MTANGREKRHTAEENKRCIIIEAYISLMCSNCNKLNIIYISPSAKMSADSVCGFCKSWRPSGDIFIIQIAGKCSECSEINWYNPDGQDALICWHCENVLWLYDRKSPPVQGERIRVVAGGENRNEADTGCCIL